MTPRDPELPFLRTAWSAAEMTRFFNERVLPDVGAARRVRTVRRERMSYRPGRDCVVLYTLEPDPGVPGGVPGAPWAVVSFGADGAFQKIHRDHYRRGADGVVPRPALFFPDEATLVELFPHDWRLPALATATDMERMTPRLAQAAGTSDRAAERWHCTVLRYHPAGRCVFRYTPGAAGAPRESSLVGKLYADRAKSARAWAALRRLADSGIYRGPWRVPEPRAHVADMNLVLMGFVSGVPVGDLLADEPRSSRTDDHIRSAARMLAALHRLPGDGLESRTIADDQNDLVKRTRDIAIVNPRLAERITALLREITARLSQLAAQRRGLLHGCLTPNQLLADGEAIAVIDFDAACHGDPAIDVGTFVGSMRKCGTKVSERRAVERSAELFLQEYGAASNDPGVVDRARLFACQELLRYAGRSFLRTAYRLGDGGGRPTRFLDEAATALSTL